MKKRNSSRVSVRDVARAAGISISAAYYALQNKPEVSRQTRGLTDAGTTGTWTLYSSLDGYTTPIVTETATNTYSSLQSSPSNVNSTGSISLTGAPYQNLTSGTTFELVFNSGGNSSAGDVLRTDNIVLDGSVVSSVPEPSTPVLLFSGMAGLLLLARRRHHARVL